MNIPQDIFFGNEFINGFWITLDVMSSQCIQSYGIKVLIIFFLKRINNEIFTRLDQYKHQEDENKSDFIELSKRYQTSLTHTVVIFQILRSFKNWLIKFESINSTEEQSNFKSLELNVNNKLIGKSNHFYNFLDLTENESEKFSKMMKETFSDDQDSTDVDNDKNNEETAAKVSKNFIRQLKKNIRYLKYLCSTFGFYTYRVIFTSNTLANPDTSSDAELRDSLKSQIGLFESILDKIITKIVKLIQSSIYNGVSLL